MKFDLAFVASSAPGNYVRVQFPSWFAPTGAAVAIKDNSDADVLTADSTFVYGRSVNFQATISDANTYSVVISGLTVPRFTNPIVNNFNIAVGTGAIFKTMYNVDVQDVKALSAAFTEPSGRFMWVVK